MASKNDDSPVFLWIFIAIALFFSFYLLYYFGRDETGQRVPNIHEQNLSELDTALRKIGLDPEHYNTIEEKAIALESALKKMNDALKSE